MVLEDIIIKIMEGKKGICNFLNEFVLVYHQFDCILDPE